MQHPAGCFSLITIQKGSVAERGVTSQVIENPTHPYVQMLIESIPVPDPTQKWSTLLTLPSEEELRSSVNTGCRYYPRCSKRMDRCLEKLPPLYQINGSDHQSACYLYDDRPIAQEES